MTFYEGRTFTMPVPGSKIPHLFFVLNNPDSNGRVAIVNITSCNNDGTDDKTLTLTDKDHPYIKKGNDSYVFYQKAVVTHTNDLTRAYNYFTSSQAHKDVSDELLLEILCGVFDSNFTPPEVVNYVGRFFNKSNCP